MFPGASSGWSGPWGDLLEGRLAKAHPGFKAVANKIAAKQGISKDRADAILAAGARKASAGAVKKNPRLARVKGK